MRRSLIVTVCLVAFGPSLRAQNICRFYLANHSGSVQGLTLSLEAQANTSGVCTLSAVNLNLSAGDGTGFHHISASQAWQTGTVYTATAVITGAGPQRLSLNGQSLGTATGAFLPAQGTFFGSDIADSGAATESYVVTQISLQVSNGSNSFPIAPNGSSPIPLPLMLMSGAVPWPAVSRRIPLSQPPSRPLFDSISRWPTHINPIHTSIRMVNPRSAPGRGRSPRIATFRMQLAWSRPGWPTTSRSAAWTFTAAPRSRDG